MEKKRRERMEKEDQKSRERERLWARLERVNGLLGLGVKGC